MVIEVAIEDFKCEGGCSKCLDSNETSKNCQGKEYGENGSDLIDEIENFLT